MATPTPALVPQDRRAPTPKAPSRSQLLIRQLTAPATLKARKRVRRGGTLLAFIVALIAGHGQLGQTLFFVIAATLFAYLALGLYLEWAANRQLRAFIRELPDLLLNIANALRAGMSLTQSIEHNAERGRSLSAIEMGIATEQMALGARPFDAMRRLATRMPCEEMDDFILALAVHENVGGDLAGTLESAATTIQQRLWLREEVRTTTTQSRISGFIVCSLPIFFLLIISALVPGYYDPMLKNPIGIGILLSALGLVATAFYSVRYLQRGAEKV